MTVEFIVKETGCQSCEHCHKYHMLLGSICLASPGWKITDYKTGKSHFHYLSCEHVNYKGKCWKYFSNKVMVKFGWFNSIKRFLFLSYLRKKVIQRGLKYTRDNIWELDS
jgi:hypothetical protein